MQIIVLFILNMCTVFMYPFILNFQKTDVLFWRFTDFNQLEDKMFFSADLP